MTMKEENVENEADWCSISEPGGGTPEDDASARTAPEAGDDGEGVGEGEEEGSPFQPRSVQKMQEDWEENLQYQENIMHAHRTAPEVEGRWTDRHMKLMVVGESGQGKTTFIHNMFMAYTGGAELPMADGSSTALGDFVADPSRLCNTFSVDNEDERVRYHYTVQDTPGYGDDLNVGNSIKTIVGYVEGCSERFFAMETEHGRLHAEANDCRVDVCLYFVAAHRLKPIDLQFIAALAPLAAVIPIIAKADSMTTSEITQYRKEVVRRLKDPGIPGLPAPIPVFQFSQEAKALAGVSHAVPPFAVVCSTETDPAVGPFWPVRCYNWGTCEALRSRDSDFAALKRLVLELSFWDIRDATEKRYLEFRRSRRAQEEQEKAAAERSRTVKAQEAPLLDALKSMWGRLSACLPSPRPEQPAAAPSPPDANSSSNSTTPFAAAAVAAAVTALLTAICLSATGILCRTEQSLYGQSSPGLLSEIREREGYIAQLQGDAMALVEALKAVNGGGQAALACLHNAPGVAHGSRQLEETAVGFAYGGMCYDEEYDPGVPWLLQLLISGCIWHAAWAAWRRCPEAPAAIGGAQAERLVGWQLMAIRAAVAILAVHCQIQLSQAFGCSGAHHHL